MDGIAVKPLTVDFHEGGFLSKLNQESKLGFWSQLSDDQKKQAGSPWGPQNPQALNCYSYVQNNPLKYTDPSGHFPGCPSFNTCLNAVFTAVRVGLYLKGVYDNFRTRSALEAFENGSPLNIVGELGSFTIDPKKLLGRNLHNVDQIDSGRLKGYGRGITEQNGGEAAARKAFEALTGRAPAGDYERVVVDGFEVVFRATSRTKSGVPTVEVIHHADRFLEKIKFLP